MERTAARQDADMTGGQTAAGLCRSRRVRQPRSMRLCRFGRIRCVLACALLRWDLDSASARGPAACSSAQVVRALHASVSWQVQKAPPSVVVKGADRASCTCPFPLAGHRARGTGVAADYDFVPGQRSSQLVTTPHILISYRTCR